MPDDKHHGNAVLELPLAIEELRALIKRAQAGDQSALPELQRVLDTVPDIWQHFGDLSDQCLASWANLIAGSNLYLRECLLRKAAAMKEEIAGADPGPLEKLLGERVVLTWVALLYYETAAGEVQKFSLPLGDFIQKRLDRAQRRHLAAIKSLATFRKLMPKAIDGQSSTPNVTPAITTREELPSNGAPGSKGLDPFHGLVDRLGPLDVPRHQGDHRADSLAPAMDGLVHRFANLVQHAQSRNGQESELAACSK